MGHNSEILHTSHPPNIVSSASISTDRKSVLSRALICNRGKQHVKNVYHNSYLFCVKFGNISSHNKTRVIMLLANTSM